VGSSEPIPSNEQFRALIVQVRNGSEDAAWELVTHYGEHLRRAVRRVFDAKLQSLFDSLDFTQLVWSSFFHHRDRIADFQRPQELAAFLVVLAQNKVRDEARRQIVTSKRNIACEQPLNQVVEEMVPADPCPKPVDVAIARERWDCLLRGQPAHYRKIMRLRLLGHTIEDIAFMLGLNESTVRRFLKRLLRDSVE
jgi:RNA polymerase sigma factor (sigma-70 family)